MLRTPGHLDLVRPVFMAGGGTGIDIVHSLAPIEEFLTIAFLGCNSVILMVCPTENTTLHHCQ